MQYLEFLNRVQERAALGSRGAAERAVRATFETLAERVTQGATNNLAAQLPREIAQYLLRRGPEVNDLSADEFWEHVAEREGTDTATAIRDARAVFETVDEAVSPGEIDDFRSELPAELKRFLEPPAPERASRTRPGR
jgi:uncharacterized protein (DUF2267 family)